MEARVQRRSGAPELARAYTKGFPLSIATSLVFVYCTFEMIGVFKGSPIAYGVALCFIAIGTVADGIRYRGYVRFRHLPTIGVMLYAAWVGMVCLVAIGNGSWAPDTLVILFGAAIPPVIWIAWRLGGERTLTSRFVAASDRLLWLSIVLFGIVAIVDGISTLTDQSPTSGLSHERVFIAVFGLGLKVERSGSVMKLILTIAILVSVVRYPSATSIAALVVASLFWLSLRSSRSRSLVTITVAATAAAAVVLPQFTSILDTFYASVGRNNNSATRATLWEQAEQVVALNPIFGGAASLPITGLANVNGVVQPVPFHNTALTLGVVAGIGAVLLLGSSVVGALGIALASDGADRQLARNAAPALAAAIVCVSVNPVLERPGTAAAFFLILMSTMLATTRKERSGQLAHHE